MRKPTLPESIEICSTKKHFLALKAVLDMKCLSFDGDETTQNKTLKSSILEEAKVLSNRTLELHDRLSNCICFPESDRKVECSSHEANEMQRHHETLKKLLKDIEEIEAHEFGLQDMKIYVPTKPLNPLSNPFVPSAKIYEHISTASLGPVELTTDCPKVTDISDRSREKSTDQTCVHNDVPHKSYEMVDISSFPYSLDKKIRSLWFETANETQYSDLCIFLINLYGRDLSTPQKYKTIWSITDEEKNLNSRYATIYRSRRTSISEKFPSNIWTTFGSHQSLKEAGVKWEPIMKEDTVRVRRLSFDNETVKSRGYPAKKEAMEAMHNRTENLYEFKRPAEAKRSLPILPSHRRMGKPSVQKSLSLPNWAVKWPSSGIDVRVLNRIRRDSFKTETGSCQVSTNSSTCDHPCSNWCDAKQLKNVSETTFENNSAQFSNILTSRQRNTQSGSQNSKISGTISKPFKIQCHQPSRSIIPSTFLKQSCTIFDTDQWSTSKLAEFRSRRDSGDSGYSSVEQSEHDFKLQPCLAATETFFSGCSEDFSKSEFENEFWTPLPDCKRGLHQNQENRHDFSNWDPTRNIRRSRRGRTDDIGSSQSANKMQRDIQKPHEQQANKMKKPVKRDFMEQKQKKK